MATRKMMTIRRLEDLHLGAGTLNALRAANVKVEQLIAAARNDAAYRAYCPGSTSGAEANHLTAIPGVGKTRAEEIISAVNEAGFILHESEESRNARRLFAEVDGGPQAFLERYETLESMEPEALEAVDEVLRALPERERQVMTKWLCQPYGGRSPLEDFAHHELGVTKERAWQLLLKAGARLRGRGNYARLKVATCYTRDALSEEMAALHHEIRRLQQELKALQDGSPYPEFRDTKAGGMPIEDLDPSVPTYNCLKRAGIRTVGELCKYTENDLLNIRNFGTRNVEEVHELLQGIGLTLAS